MTHNPIRPWRNIDRRPSRRIHVGPVAVGGGAPISVQTMTNTLTTDVGATVAQVQACADAGADIVRVSCPDEGSTRALSEMKSSSGIGRAEALRISMRELVQRGASSDAHPARWAPFVVVGEGAR